MFKRGILVKFTLKKAIEQQAVVDVKMWAAQAYSRSGYSGYTNRIGDVHTRFDSYPISSWRIGRLRLNRHIAGGGFVKGYDNYNYSLSAIDKLERV